MRTAETFPPDADSIPAARRFVLAAISSAPADQRDAVSVMVSELAMNAVQHARTRFRVTVEITDGSLRVEVTDSGGGRPTPRPLPDPTSPRGRGLFIVDRLSHAWGTSPSAGPFTSVWFTLALDVAAGSVDRQPASTDEAPLAESPAGPSTPPPPDSPPPQHGRRAAPDDLLTSR